MNKKIILPFLYILAIVITLGFAIGANWTDPASSNEGIRGFWHFNDNDLTDSSGYGNDLSVLGSSTPPVINSSGKFEEGLNFITNGGQINSSAFYNFTDHNYTVEFWYFPHSIPAQKHIWTMGTASNYHTLYQISGNQICLQSTFTGGNFGCIDTISTGVWTHIAVTKGEDRIHLYVDGVRQTTASSGALPAPTGTEIDWTAGEVFKLNRPGTGAQAGSYILDQILLWNVSRTASEIISDAGNANGTGLIGEFLVPLNNSFELTGENINFTGNFTPVGGTIFLENATVEVWDKDGVMIYTETQDMEGNVEATTTFTQDINQVGDFSWNIWGCGNTSTGSNCVIASEYNVTFHVAFNENTFTINSTTYESSVEGVGVNATFDSTNFPTITATFNNNGTKTSVSTTDTGNERIYGTTYDVPLGNVTRNALWEFTIANSTTTYYINSSTKTVDVGIMNLTLLDIGAQTVPFINFSFKNETIGNEQTTAFVPTSSFTYSLGASSVNRTYSFTSAVENGSYSLGFSPPHLKPNIDISIAYDNSEAQQRTFAKNILRYSNITTNYTLLLLPTGEGIFVTFQVINAAGQPINGALVQLEASGFGVVSSTTTGASGTTNVFLNPNTVYTLTVSADNFETFTASQTFPTTEFTVTLGSSTTSSNDYIRGIYANVFPKSQLLMNNTQYNFNLTLNSSFWNLDSFGFTLKNQTDTLASTSSTTSTGGFLSQNLNTNNNTLLEMEYFWIIDGNYNNRSIYWAVGDQSDGSILGFFKRLKSYLDDGIFGVTNFGVALIMFLIVFVTVGILSFKFGLRAPAAIMAVAATLIILFSIDGIDLLPETGGIKYLVPIIMVLAIIVVIVGGKLASR